MKQSGYQQKGMISIEFTLVGVFFIFFILVAIDTGRWMMTWSMLNQASHRVANAAAVMSPSDKMKIKQAGLFEVVSGDKSATIPGLEIDHFNLKWLQDDGNLMSVGSEQCAKFVRSSITMHHINPEKGFKFVFFSPMPFFGLDKVLTFPDFQVTVPGESLGSKEMPACNGS